MSKENPYLELAAQEDNPYLATVQGDTARQVRNSVSATAGIDPDKDAKIQQLAREYQVPLDAARIDPKTLENKQKVDSFDYGELARNSPGTANFLSDPKNSAISSDDVENMSMIEKLWNEAKNLGTTISNAASRGGQAQSRKWTTNSFNSNARTIQDIDRIEQMIADGVDPNSNAFNLENDPLGLAQMSKEDRARIRSQSLASAKDNAQEISIKTNNMAAIKRPEVTDKVMNANKVIDEASSYVTGDIVYGEDKKGWEAFSAAFSEFAKSPANFIADVGVESLVGNIDTLIAAVPATLLGGPGLGATVMGLGSYNTDYSASFLESLSEQGVDIRDPKQLTDAMKNPEVMAEARRVAHTHALTVSLFDAAGAGVASKVALPRSLQTALKDKPLAKELVNILAIQPPVQGTLGALGEFAAGQASGKEVNYGELIGEFFGESLGAPAEVLVASSKRLYGNFVKVDQSEEMAARLKQLDDLATASKVRSRDVDTFEKFVASATEDGPIQSVYIDANTLAQSGMADVLMQALPSVAEQFESALQAGGQVSIPVAEYTARVAGTELSQSLLQHLRTEPDGFSQVEAQSFMQSYSDDLKAEVERTLMAREGDAKFKAEVESVKENVKTQLNTAGRFTSEVNDAYSAMIGNFYGVMAGKLNIAPDELLSRYPLRIQAQSVAGGQQFDQAGKLKVDTPEFKSWFDKSKVTDESGKPLVVYPQIKSVNNRGTFDANDPNILNQGWFPDSNRQLKVVTLDNLFSGANVNKQAQSYFQNNLQGTTVNNEAVGDVRFSSESIGKIMSSGRENPLKMSIVQVLPDLIKNADLMGAALDEKGRPGVDAFKYLVAPLWHDGKLFSVQITLKKSKEGNKLYSVEGFKADTVAAVLGQDPSAVAEFNPGSGTELPIPQTVSVGNLLSEVNELNRYFQNDVSENARGAFNPATNTITLLKSADLSTFLHESGHFFLETQFDIAARIAQEVEAFGIDPNNPGQKQIVEDTNSILKWFGIADLNEWNSLDFEEKRSYHERFARGFEAYLFEGKAPSIEVQGVFQRFRAWMLNVYKDMKNLNVELNDEVRGVFDRMLATNEQIELAEQARSMMPLFTSADQGGMTIEEFAAYQATEANATNDAIQDLQARGLRDLAWSRNARGREIKKLQKQAAARRAEVTMDVRREVMSQPIYRAWQFLTAKLSDNDKITPEALPKSDPNFLDETIDSLHTAIAKLGGLDRAQVESKWGFDPKERSPMPAFGKYTLRREGGLKIDAMGEALAELGYLAKDENGRFDSRELEEKFDAEMRGDVQYSIAVDERVLIGEGRAGEGVDLGALGAGRIDLGELKGMGLPSNIIEIMQGLKMTAKNGIHPDLISDMFGFTSGDELVRTLAIAQEPKQEINDQVDARMLELYGELATPEAIEREADKAIHNENRARNIATEANALSQAMGRPKILAKAAKDFANSIIARLKIRDIRPGQYSAAEVRAAKAAQKASEAGDIATAAAEKRNQLVNNYATKAAYNAQDEVESGVRYLKKFDSVIKGLDADYADQIGNLLERFDLRKGQSLKAIDKRTALAEWLKSQLDQGFEPEVPSDLQNEAYRKSYKDMTVEEFRGLVDTVKQIEHLGRLKNKLLTAADAREFDAVRTELLSSIEENSNGREADARTPTTTMGRKVASLKSFFASHVKAATWARIMDGGKDGGAVWQYFIRPANERGDMETTMRAEATKRLSEIMAPVFKLGKMGGKGIHFPGINRSLNREARIAIALNTGNEGNLQRLLGGEGWTMEQLTPILSSLTKTEWTAVQDIWDHLESYRPLIGAKEKRVYGKEPDWVEARPFQVRDTDGTMVNFRGGYYPIKYDPAASQRAEEFSDAEGAKRQLQGAFTSATTKRSFTKSRAEEVSGRPLLYSLAGMYSGVNDVIHDLAWHEWLIDVNRLLRSTSIDKAIRETYGPQVKNQFKTWVNDIAEGEKAATNEGERALSYLRQNVSIAGLGYNVMSAAMQPLGFTQSIVRIGPRWVASGIAKFISSPLETYKMVNEMSPFMANRFRTRFRELNELRNKVDGENNSLGVIKGGAYYMMMRLQQMVDIPTFIGAYEKSMAAGQDEARAVQLAEQAVIDAQGGGQTKDLSAIERGGPALKLFTVFYTFMNTTLQLAVSQTMTANTPAKKAKLAADYLLLFTIPAVLSGVLKDALTPGGDDEEDMDKLAKKLAAEQISYMMGTMVVVREFSEAGKIVTGAEGTRDYAGPGGLRIINDVFKFGKQAKQGEFDDAFRKASINLIGDILGLPSAQINRTITGTKALVEGKTENPAAVIFGFQRK